jgi:hypothetical protein
MSSSTTGEEHFSHSEETEAQEKLEADLSQENFLSYRCQMKQPAEEKELCNIHSLGGK